MKREEIIRKEVKKIMIEKALEEKIKKFRRRKEIIDGLMMIGLGVISLAYAIGLGIGLDNHILHDTVFGLGVMILMCVLTLVFALCLLGGFLRLGNEKRD